MADTILGQLFGVGDAEMPLAGGATPTPLTVPVPSAQAPVPVPVPAQPTQPLTPIGRMLQTQQLSQQSTEPEETPIRRLLARQPPTPATAPAPAPAPADTSLQPLKLLESGYHALRAGIYATGAASDARNLNAMAKIDAGEAVPETDDPYGYQHMTPEQRTAYKTQLTDTQTS